MIYRSISLIPAYGRDYKSKRAVLKDWTNGLDFRIQDYRLGDRYCSVRDLPELQSEGVTHLNFRYKSLTEVAVVKLN